MLTLNVHQAKGMSYSLMSLKVDLKLRRTASAWKAVTKRQSFQDRLGRNSVEANPRSYGGSSPLVDAEGTLKILLIQ